VISFSKVQARARALAQSGKFAGWKAIAFELKFDPGYQEASQWLFNLATREEIDLLCNRARESSKRRNIQAA
jgi:hypothetical protein